MNARLLLTAALAASLAACGGDPDFDDNSQVGPDPALPAAKTYLFPPMGISPGIGWKKGEAPTVAAGLEIRPLATGLAHPRFVYTLPNGDILAVQGASPGRMRAATRRLLRAFALPSRVLSYAVGLATPPTAHAPL